MYARTYCSFAHLEIYSPNHTDIEIMCTSNINVSKQQQSRLHVPLPAATCLQENMVAATMDGSVRSPTECAPVEKAKVDRLSGR